MDNGWQSSADAWIADQGEHGDFGRRYVLDPAMLPLIGVPKTALDIGCGEGRFTRILHGRGITAVGLDPTPALIAAARTRHQEGSYIQAAAESLPFANASFDLAVAYLTLIDIPNFQDAISEAARVLKPGGRFLIANLTSVNTAGLETGWVKGADGRRVHYPIDNYLDERPLEVDYRGIRIVNHHRPLSAYMRALLDVGLTLSHFNEPEPIPATPPAKAAAYRRVPWFLIMEWRKPA